MSPATAAHSAALDGCAEILARLAERVRGLRGMAPDQVHWGHVGDATRLLELLGQAEASTGARHPGPEFVASAFCPACGGDDLGTAERILGVARGRIEGGRFVPSGETRIAWESSETERLGGSPVLECLFCGARWVYPALVAGEP